MVQNRSFPTVNITGRKGFQATREAHVPPELHTHHSIEITARKSSGKYA
jgi:hypothetical protein